MIQLFLRSNVLYAIYLCTYFCTGVMEGPCECREGWASCTENGEDGLRGCVNTGKSCAQICQGSFGWKQLYQKTVDDEVALTECEFDPTAKWGAMGAGTDGPFAVAFANGLRNFLATWHSWKTNLVDVSGTVDLYFHGST